MNGLQCHFLLFRGATDISKWKGSYFPQEEKSESEITKSLKLSMIRNDLVSLNDNSF